jgi:hypothetical protein
MKDTRDLYGTYEVVFDGSELYPDLTSFSLYDERVVSGNSYIFRVKAKYQNGFSLYSTESLPVFACLPPRNLDQVKLQSVSKTQMTFTWSQPKFKSSCDLIGFALFMNNGAGGDTLAEIDASTIRSKPLYTTHTTTAPSTVGATYLFQLRAYNINGVTVS